MSTTTEAPAILSSKFLIRDQHLSFWCTARGHREGQKLVVDDVTIIDVFTVHCGRAILLTLAVNDREFCERKLRQHDDLIVAEVAKAERAELESVGNP